MKTVITLFLIVIFSGSAYAEVPQEIQGTWTPDVDQSIALMKENMSELDEAGIAVMRDRLLPSMKRTISENQYVHTSGGRELKAEISLKEKQGSNFVMIISNASTKIVVTFIPQDNGKYIMQSQNPSDGSGNILWEKQQ